MELPAAPEPDHIRNDLVLLNINEPTLSWNDCGVLVSGPRATPSTSRAALAMRTVPRDSRGSIPSAENWMPSSQAYSSPSYPRPPSQGSREQRPTTGRSQRQPSASHYSLYPAPTKPLPPVPAPKNNLTRLSSAESTRRSSASTTRSSRSSGPASYTEPNMQDPTSPHIPASPPSRNSRDGQHRQVRREPTKVSVNRTFSQRSAPKPVSLHFWKDIVSNDKKVNNSVHYLDISPTVSVLASKHGNNLVKVWSMASGELQSAIKFSSYTEARSRSRDYLIRSHAVLSESGTLLAIATRFGRSIEVFNWTRKKSIQTIGDADRWASARFDMFDGERCPLAVYCADAGRIDLYSASQESKKPLFKQRTIELSKSGLPFIPELPELAISATSPLVVAAAGPRPPIAGHPPPQRGTLLVAWETSDGGSTSNEPYRVARPWHHEELDTAIPCDLVTYGSVVVSTWIPASFRAVPVPADRKGSGYNLTRVKVPLRYVLVWDLSANSTRTIGIPNCTSCISPDCRFVAYCDASGWEIGARGSMVILDVITGEEVWCWPDKNANSVESSSVSGFGQFDDLASVTELSFSGDGRFLVVGDGKGHMGVYDVRV